MIIKGIKSNFILLVSAMCLFCIFIVGCGSNAINRTTLEFNKDGSFVLHIVDTLDESKYSYEELNALNEAEVNVYNSYGKGSVSIEKSSFENGIVYIDMKYSDDDVYYDMNHIVLYYGTVKAAKNAGYNIVGKMTSTSDGSGIDQAILKTMDENKLIIVSEDIDVIAPSKITYISEGVTVLNSKSVEVSGEGLHYIVCE